MSLGNQVSTSDEFPHAKVYKKEERGGLVYSVVFRNREPRTGLMQGAVAILVFGSTVAFLWLGISGRLSEEQTMAALVVVGAVWVLGLGYLAWPYRPEITIEIDNGRAQLRVLKNGRQKLARNLGDRVPDFTIEEHPQADWERRRTQGRIGILQKQHCLFGWFGHGGASKTMLVARLEYPSQESLYEIRQAILYAIGHASAAMDEEERMAGGGRGMQPPLD